MTPFGTYIVETLATLVAVIALAILVLFGAKRIGLGRPLGPLEVIGRLPLEGRRSVYLVRIVDKVYVLGASEAGIAKLGELELESVQASLPARTAFRDVMAQIMERRRGRASAPNGEESTKQ
jgi:flagellar biogenesis protein FliO